MFIARSVHPLPGEAELKERLLALIEDVRWAILVPDAVDRRAGGVRQSLARWSSTERQDAALRLGRAGRDAIPALAELAGRDIVLGTRVTQDTGQ